MTNKSYDRIYRPEKPKKINCNNYYVNESQSDEIALRDEILELKKQVAFLKKTNEKNFIKFRKYEEEVKRKDREIEQLMDPRKNSEITKILSTKGAALLLNLKDQNNSLIQMVLNKDLQIKRLTAEIKMSKLYTATKKNNSNAQKLNRLKNILSQLQDTLKENTNCYNNIAQQQDNGSTAFDFSSSSEQSSPRESNDLMVTLQSLENYVKYSNDLLTKKNQEISFLSEELKMLKKTLRYKEYKCKKDNRFAKFETKDSFLSKRQSSKEKLRFRFFQKTEQLTDSNLPEENRENEETPKMENFLQNHEQVANELPETNLQSLTKNLPEKEEGKCYDVESQNQNLFSATTSSTLAVVMKLRQERRSKIREKWRKAWAKQRQLKKELLVNSEQIVRQPENVCQDESQEEKTESLDEVQEKVSEPETHILTPEEVLTCEDVEVKEETISPEKKPTSPILILSDPQTESDVYAESIKEKLLAKVEKESEESTCGNQQTDNHESTEGETIFNESYKEVYQDYLDSSFESENNYVEEVTVEVQINTKFIQENGSNTSILVDEGLSTDKNLEPEYDDDDDVVFESKEMKQDFD